jgi:predicted NAD-dependent protein-ADP-ribosyltransferase YbiA (DUF1768 family)
LRIASFSGDYSFLSNFHPSPVLMDGQQYPTVEHAFQAAKTTSVAERQVIQMIRSPGQAKRQGRKVTFARWVGAYQVKRNVTAIAPQV